MEKKVESVNGGKKEREREEERKRKLFCLCYLMIINNASTQEF